MIRNAEKLGIMKVRAVTVCAKVGLGRKSGHKKYVFTHIFRKTASEKNFFEQSKVTEA